MKNKGKKGDIAVNKKEINAIIENAGKVIEQPITETLEKNYMPYAMSVIVSRAIPEIDGFKPAHRKLLYTMYKMGLLSGAKTKSANVVGQTMRLNPHGDASIYETLVRLSKGYNVLLHPYVDSKGNFGKSYSRDMAYAASRYTEVKLADISKELFLDIDKNTVEFIDNYDNTMKEPILFPVTFPSILINSNVGIAVGMASCICSFNLKEVCETTIRLIKNGDLDIKETLKAPDFSTGGYLLYDEGEINKIYEMGKGSFKVRSKYSYDKINRCIEISEIPPSTTVEAIIEKIIELVKQGKVKEISDVRDETDLNGLKIAIDIKRGVEVNKLIDKLYKYTPLEDSFSCNFNMLIKGEPKVMGIREIINEWIEFRKECVKRRIRYDVTKKEERLHLLYGLKKILLDIDKAIKIIRKTKLESEVIKNLMKGFKIDETQANYIAEIKLRNLNEENIIKKVDEINELEIKISEMKDILAKEEKINEEIIKELKQISQKYGQDRKTEILKEYKRVEKEEKVEEKSYLVKYFLTKEGYFKKITLSSLKFGKEQKLKQGDEIIEIKDGNNLEEILFFSDKNNVYKTKGKNFDDLKTSMLGEYLPAKLGLDDKENIIYMAVINKYIGYMLFFYEDGKVAKVEIKSYETKTNRKKLISAYSDKSKVISIAFIEKDGYFMIKTKKGRFLILDTKLLAPKQTKDTAGVKVINLKKGDIVHKVTEQKINNIDIEDEKINRMITKRIPVAGVLNNNNKIENDMEQITFL